MNSTQIHLGLTHVPVILSIVGLVMLIIALLLKNNTLTKTAYIIIMIAGIATIPVYLTGEGAEETVEHLPGVSEAIIERHEELAKLAMFSIAAAGLLALTALLSFKWLSAARVLKVVVLLVAVVSGGLMFQTAHLGGQIRHSEIRNELAARNGNEADIKSAETEHDND